MPLLIFKIRAHFKILANRLIALFSEIKAKMLSHSNSVPRLEVTAAQSRGMDLQEEEAA